MPKKGGNGFFLFTLDYKRREESKGRRFRGMKHATEAAGAIWKEMDDRQRAPFIEKAKQQKGQQGQTEEKYTSLGVPLSQLAREQREKELKIQRTRSMIVSMINSAAENNSLETLDFYFISFHYFCELSDGRFVPAEIGAVRWTLMQGIVEKFHTLINPGPLPPGMAFEAQKHSTTCHQLPPPPDAFGEENFDTIAQQLVRFLSKRSGKMPLLFTDRSNMRRVESMLEDILQDHVSREDMPLVCPLTEMFFLLKKTILQISFSLERAEDFPSESYLQQLITRDVYEYTENISCEFHESKGNVTDCCLSLCTRWAYVVMDLCCLDLNIDLVPGKHIPAHCSADYYLTDSTSKNTGTTVRTRTSFLDSKIEHTNPTYRGENLNSTVSSNYLSSAYTPRSAAGSSNNDTLDRKPTIAFEPDSDLDLIEPLPPMAPVAGRGYNFAPETLNQFHGLGRGRVLTFDNTPPVAPGRKSFK